jgi:hypothetical protein
VSVSVFAPAADLASRSSCSSMCRVFFIHTIVPYVYRRMVRRFPKSTQGKDSSGSAWRGYANSLNGLKTLSPGRLKSRSFPVAIVRPCRRAVAAM